MSSMSCKHSSSSKFQSIPHGYSPSANLRHWSRVYTLSARESAYLIRRPSSKKVSHPQHGAAWQCRGSRRDTKPVSSSTEFQCGGSKGFVAPLMLSATAMLLGHSQLAQAAGVENVANLVAQAVPEAVSSAVASTITPVAEKTAAFIPGLIGDSPLREGAVQGFLLILFSELGDKTFFLAVLLALKENKGVVFGGTFGALAAMSVISVLIGQIFHEIDELNFAGSKIPFDDLLAVALLIFFGVKTIQEARDADKAAAEEREEAEEDVQKLGEGALGLFLSTFALVFAAEWGDKSFLATIALAAASSPTGVVLGAIGGHGVATGIAVVGGSYLGKYVDERVVQYVGGSLFLVFAGATIVDIARGIHP